MKKLAIDPGHFGGTLSILENRHFLIKDYPPVKEGDITLKVAERLQTLLKNSDFEVLISRDSFELFTEGTSWSPSSFETFKRKHWEERASRINAFAPSFTVAIHFNSNCYSNEFLETKHNGVMTFIGDKNNSQLIEHAKTIGQNLATDFKLPFCKKSWFSKEISELWEDIGAGVNLRDLFILKHVNAPIVLAEGPFMNNREVYISLTTSDSLVETFAGSLYKSIKEIL